MKSPIELALPVFYAAIAVEAVVSARRQDGRVRARSTFANLAVGAGNFVADTFWVLLAYKVFWVFYRESVFKIPTHQLWSWMLLFFLDDLGYYWFHRASHRVRILWASHVVHHSSEEYNLSTATRQTWTGGALSWLFWAPLALLGFHPFAILVMQALSLLYQFFLHTQYVGKRRPWAEWILNTPSHHRAHHGRNAEYIDRNYGGVLIVWDRIFGTFEPENEVVRYGITTPLVTHNPFVIALHEYGAMGRDLVRSRSVAEVLGRVLRGPEWVPETRDRPEATAPVADFTAARGARRLRSANVTAKTSPARPRGVRGLLLAAVVLAGLPIVWGFAAEAYMQEAIASELTAEVESVARFTGVLEERGVLDSSVVVSRVTYRAPGDLEVEALEPESVRGDVFSVSSGTLILYSHHRDAAVRVAHVPVADPPSRGKLARELVRVRVADYAYEERPAESIAGNPVIPWLATPRRASTWTTAGTTWLALGRAWTLRARIESPTGAAPFEATYREARFDSKPERDVDFKIPSTASLVDWDLADDSLPIEAARAAADFKILEPHDAPLGLERTRIVRARAHWPTMLGLVYRSGPWVATVTELAERGLVPAPISGWPVRLGHDEARVSFVAEWTVVSLVRDGVNVTVFTNLPEAQTLAFTASLGRP